MLCASFFVQCTLIIVNSRRFEQDTDSNQWTLVVVVVVEQWSPVWQCQRIPVSQSDVLSLIDKINYYTENSGIHSLLNMYAVILN